MKKHFSNLLKFLNKANRIMVRVCRVFFISLEDILLPRRALCVALGDGEISLIHGFKFLLFRKIRG